MSSDSCRDVVSSNLHLDLCEDLDIAELRRAFSAKGRVLIARILRPECAWALSECLAAEPAWALSLDAGMAGRRFLKQDSRKDLSALQLREIFESAYSSGGRAFSHLYETFSFYENQEAGLRGPILYQRLLTLINSESFLKLARSVTGIEGIDRATASACRYSRGHFYAAHVDANGGGGHVATFVLNLTPVWEPQWGGLLQFRGEKGVVDEAYVPRFNSMSLILASQPHSVSLVSPFAPHPRLSIAGALIAGKSH